MELEKSVAEVEAAADTAALAQHLRIEILGPIRFGERHDCRIAARMVWAVVEEELDLRSRTRMPSAIDPHNSTGTGC